MRNDHPALGDVRRDLRQAFRDVLVGETMKSVAPHALGVKLMRNRIMVCDRIMRAVKRGVETGHLRKIWKIGQEGADRRQIIWLMQRGEADQPLQPGHDAMVDQNRPVINRATMNDAMSHSDRTDAKLIPQPAACNPKCNRDVWYTLDRISTVGQGIAISAARSQR